jgi:tight adherence protein C
MSEMGAELLSGENAAMLLAAYAAFTAVAVLAMPGDRNPKLKARLRSVSRERDRLRERRLSELTLRSKQKVRKEGSGLIGRIAKHFKDEERSADGCLAATLRMAGFRSQNAEAIFLFFRALSPLVFSLLTLALFALTSPSGVSSASAMTFCVVAAAIGYTLPRLFLDRLIARRQKTILRAFPDALDLLLICVQSGMSVEAALGRVTKDISPQCIELAEELSLTMAELSYLPVRWRAYANLSERIGVPAVKLITAALIQAERHGTSIGQALAVAAREGREARITDAERQAATLPPKLAVPLVVFFLPVLLTVILAPALMQANDTLKNNTRIVVTEHLKPRLEK